MSKICAKYNRKKNICHKHINLYFSLLGHFLSGGFCPKPKNIYVKKQYGHFYVCMYHGPLWMYMNSLRNDVYNLFVNTHVRIKIYHGFYHCIIYIPNEGRHLIEFFYCILQHVDMWKQKPVQLSTPETVEVCFCFFITGEYYLIFFLLVGSIVLYIHGEVYSVQHYAIKFVSDLWHVSRFLLVLLFSQPIKLSSTI
jgi:hypothetical protein